MCDDRSHEKMVLFTPREPWIKYINYTGDDIAIITTHLVFTREDGSRVSKDMIHNRVQKAIKATGVKKFSFRNRETQLSRSGHDKAFQSRWP